jgi:hypothetical protein
MIQLRLRGLGQHIEERRWEFECFFVAGHQQGIAFAAALDFEFHARPVQGAARLTNHGHQLACSSASSCPWAQSRRTN